MELKVDTHLDIARPTAEVFEAIVDPEKMSKYFISSGVGRMDREKNVLWRFSDHGGVEFPVKVLEMVKEKRISFQWPVCGTESRVDIDLTPSRIGTRVGILEGPWSNDAAGIAALSQQTQGWMHFLCCLKAHLEHGINLRADTVRG